MCMQAWEEHFLNCTQHCLTHTHTLTHACTHTFLFDDELFDIRSPNANGCNMHLAPIEVRLRDRPVAQSRRRLRGDGQSCKHTISGPRSGAADTTGLFLLRRTTWNKSPGSWTRTSSRRIDTHTHTHTCPICQPRTTNICPST